MRCAFSCFIKYFCVFIIVARPQLKVNLKTPHLVWGVANIAGKIFVANDNQNRIKVFQDNPPFDALQDIVVDGLQSPWDIAACPDKSQLYIADRVYIWRVDVSSSPKSNDSICKFIKPNFMPYTLSVASTNLVITSDDGHALYVYNADGYFVCHLLPPHCLL